MRADQATRNATERERCAIDPEYKARRRAVYKRWAERNPEKSAAKQRRFQLWSKYGLTEMDYELGVAACGGCCEICGEKVESRLYIDHIHGTKMVRGLLCKECNFGLGKFKDSPTLLRKAAEYLEKDEGESRWPTGELLPVNLAVSGKHS